MKNTIIKTGFLGLMLVFGLAFGASEALAATSFNTHPQDCRTVTVGNKTDGTGIGSVCWPLSSVSADAGETINVRIYLHNSGGEDARNVRVRLTPQNTGTGTTHTYTASILADNASTVSGSVTVNTSSSQSLSYGQTRLAVAGQETSLPYSQSGSEIFSSTGLRLGTVPHQGPEDGVVMVSFRVSNNQTSLPACSDNIDNDGDGLIDFPNDPGCTSASDTNESNSTPTYYACNDGVDNDGDGLVDFPNDPGCTSSTDNDEYNSGTPTGTRPDADTLSATNVTDDSARLRAEVDGKGLTTTAWFRYGRSQNSLGSSTNEMLVGTGETAFSDTITNLDEDTTYYYQVLARNAHGTEAGEVESFRTDDNGDDDNNDDSDDISIVTRDASNISQNAAILNADYESDRDAEIWFRYGTNTSMNQETSRRDVENGSDDFTFSVQNLQEDTTYYFEAVIENSRGEREYGGRESFRTAEETSRDEKPNITTLNATSVGRTSATLNARWDANNEPVTVWFEWGDSSSLRYETVSRYEGTGSGNTSITINNLEPGERYYFRAVARNAEGTVRDGILTFTTNGDRDDDDDDDFDPGVQGTFTVLATSIGSSSAQLNGITRGLGNISKTSWFEYGTTTALGNRTTDRFLGTLDTQTFSSSVSGLSANTTYYFRAVVQTANGQTSRGSILSFRTLGTGAPAPAPAPVGANVIDFTITNRDELACPLDSVDYILTYKNVSGRTVNNSFVRVVLPTQIDFEESTDGNYSESTRTLFVNIDALSPNEQGTIFVEGAVNKNADRGDTLIVSAALSYTNPASNRTEETNSYIFTEIDEDCGRNSDLAAFSIFGNSSFLPNTLVEWLLTILIIFGLVFLGRKLYTASA